MGEPARGRWATDTLRHDHKTIQRALAVLEAIAARVVAGEAVPAAAVQDLLALLQSCAGHHANEEELLFPALAAGGLAREQRLIESLVREHRESRELLTAMEEALASLPDPQARRRFTEAAWHYNSLVGGHIFKEDHLLFPAAHWILDPRQHQELAAAFAARDQAGASEREELLGRLQELARAWL